MKLTAMLNFIPEKQRAVVDLVIEQVPFLKCALEGHDPLPLVAGRKVARNDEGVKQVRCCKRCNLCYWEEPV
jgi:hypothetical protein